MRLLWFINVFWISLNVCPAFSAIQSVIDDEQQDESESDHNAVDTEPLSFESQSRLSRLKSASNDADDDDMARLLEEELHVIELTARNFAKTMWSARRGTIWLIEFYSPRCFHCVEFTATYSEIARTYHATTSKPSIKVARINGELERALASRFGVHAYPSFYIVDGFSVYPFEQVRLKRTLMEFAEGGYKKTDAIPFYGSPMGPLGLLQGLLILVGVWIHDLFVWTQKFFGLSTLMVGMIFFGSLFIGCFIFIVLLALICPPKYKQD